MTRQFVLAILSLLLTGCTTNVSARPGQGSVAYVQVGDSVRLKVDLDRKKVDHLLDSEASSASAAHVVKYEDDIDVSSLASLEGCWRLKADWRALPDQFGSVGSTGAGQGSFAIANGVLIDTKKRLYLSGICPRAITSAVTAGDVLLFSRKEVTGAFTKQGRVLGLEYSDREIIARAETRGAPPSDISRLTGKVRALSLDPATGNALVIREVSRVQAGHGGWLRALAGHPKQTAEYDLVMVDKLTHTQEVIKLSRGEPGQTAMVWF